MNLPSRGERESATTTRYTGFFFDPTRVNLMRTAKRLPPRFLSLLTFVGFCRFSLPRLRSCGRRVSRQGAEVRQLALAHAFHELLHLLARFHQAVDFLYRRSRSVRDPPPPRAVDHLRQPSLLRCHRQDDRLDATELFLVHLVHSLELLADARNHLQYALDRPHAAQHLVALEEIVEAELAFHHAGLEVLLIVLLDRLLGALDESQDVAHAEDARGHEIGMEVLELVELLADRDQLDRAAGDGLDGQRRATARVAVELRHHDAVERDPFLERERDVHGLLARHRVDDEQHVRGLRLVADALELLHQLLVHVEPAGRVEDDRVDALGRELPEAVTHDGDRIRAFAAIDRNLDLLAELLELVDRRGPLQVGGDEPRAAAFLSQHERQLRGG